MPTPEKTETPTRPRAKPGPKPRPGGGVKNRLSIRAGDRWDQWLAEQTTRLGLDKAVIIDHALELYARTKGLPPPPSRYE